MDASEDPGTSFGSSFHPPLRVPSRRARITAQSALLLLVGSVVLVFHGLSFDLTPWSQVMINQIVEGIYPDDGQKDTTVVLFQERNLRELKAGYPVSYEVQADVFEALASYGPRAVFIDFVFIDERPHEDRLRAAMCKLSAAVDGRLYLAAPVDDQARVTMQEKFGACAHLVSALVDPDTGVSGVLTYCSGTWGLRGCVKRKGEGPFIPSAAFAMARHRIDVAPTDGERMEILWPSKTSWLNRRWMKCDQEGDARSRLRTRIKEEPLEVKEECPYTNTVSVAHVLGTFDPDVEQAIRNKAVFYGGGFDVAADRVVSPTYQDLPGVYLHAMAYDNLLSLGKNYKRADRVGWGRPTWRAAVADLGLLIALVGLWVVGGEARGPALSRRGAAEGSERSPKTFLDRLALTILLAAGVVVVIGSGKLGSEGAVLWTALGAYCVYKVVVRRDGLFLMASGLVATAAIASFYLLNLGPRNIVGYLAFFEIARHLTEYLDEGARRYVRFRGEFPSDGEWGTWARWRRWLDSAIGVWLRGRIEGGRHDQALGVES